MNRDPKNPTDETETIVRSISLAAHNYGRSRTKYLTDLRSTSEPEIPEEHDASFSQFHPADYSSAYRSRLFTRNHHRKYFDAPPFVQDHARIVHSPSFRKLQGKSQLIPAGESDVFRTRLTHSIEVAEIAQRIARRLNKELGERYQINRDLVTCSCLLHDIGHPPFGHNGEAKLNELMRGSGGFESNAQTLRLITKLENRLGRGGEVQDAYSNPSGLNLTVGVLSSILKYDRLSKGPGIDDDPAKITKGYYPEEECIVIELKRRLGVPRELSLCTVECQIMDIADDIAYSAYDLDDTMEAGIVVPFDLVSVYDDSLEAITRDVDLQMEKHASAGRAKYRERVTETSVLRHLNKLFESILTFADPDHPYDLSDKDDRAVFVARSYNESILHARNHLIRRQFLETLIEMNIRGVKISYNKEHPFLSTLTIDTERLLAIECLKAYNFHRVISSRKLQVPQHGAREIIGFLFNALEHDTGGLLLSEVHRMQFRDAATGSRQRKRQIADILASLTDLEAVQLFKRLRSGGSFFSYI